MAISVVMSNYLLKMVLSPYLQFIECSKDIHVVCFFFTSVLWNLTVVFYSVLTPYYKEDVLYSDEELNKENEDGISILFYLKKIYPGESSVDLLSGPFNAY